jgi:hypothetical protein
MLRRVALVRNEVSEELSASFIRVTRIGELGTLAVTTNRHTLRRRRYVPPKRPLLQEPHGVTSQKTPFFIVTAVKTSKLTQFGFFLDKPRIYGKEGIRNEGYWEAGMVSRY